MALLLLLLPLRLFSHFFFFSLSRVFFKCLSLFGLFVLFLPLFSQLEVTLLVFHFAVIFSFFEYEILTVFRVREAWKKSFYLKKNFSLIQWQQLAFCPLIQTAQAHEGKKQQNRHSWDREKNPRNSKLWTTRSDGETKRASEWDRDDRHTKLCEFISKNANII